MGTLTKAVFIVLILFSLHGQSTAGEIGCFKRDPKNLSFRSQPSGYKREELTSVKCSVLCGAIKSRYALITMGQYCFCSDTLPTESRRSPSGCTHTCSGESNQICGGPMHFTIFDAIQPIRGLMLMADSAALEAGVDTQSFSLSITEGINPLFAFDYGDGAGKMENNATGMLSRKFDWPENYTVRVYASVENSTDELVDGVTVKVKARAENLEVTCPLFITLEQEKCEVKVWSGTDMDLEYSLDNVLQGSIRLPDPMYKTIGTPVPSKGTYPISTYGIQSFFVMPHAEIQNDGVLHGWLYHATGTGTVHFLILSPECASDQYCYGDNGCSASCSIDSPAKRHCGAPNILTICSVGNNCVDGATCAATNRYANTVQNAYTIKHDVTVTISQTGYDYHRLTELDKKVSPGDIIGIFGNAIGYRTESDPLKADDYDSSITSMPTSIASAGFSDIGKAHFVQAVISTGSTAFLPFVFQQAGSVTLNVKVENFGSAVTLLNNTQIQIAEGVNEVIPNLRAYYATNEAISFTTFPHMGTDVTYTWDFGDGTVTNTTDKTYSYTYSTPGTYNVSVIAFNDVSERRNFTQVIIQTTVTGLAISVVSSTQRTDEDTQVMFSMLTGSDFTCNWQHGDTTTNTTTEFDLNKAGDTYYHRYASQGSKTFTVTCFNDVSTMTKTISFEIQEPIEGLDFVSKGAPVNTVITISWKHDLGTSPAFTLTVDDLSFEYNYDTVGRIGVTKLTFGPYNSPRILKLNLTASNELSRKEVLLDFAVEESLDNVITTPNATWALIESTITFAISASQGSGVTCNIDYNDNTTTTMPGTPGVTFSGLEVTHLFLVPGIYNVQINVSNSFNFTTHTHVIHVLARVENLHAVHPGTVNTPLFFGPPTDITFTFFQSPVTYSPNEANVELYFFDGNIYQNTTEPFQLTSAYKREFRNTGEMDVTAKVYNKLSFQEVKTKVKIIDPVINPRVTSEYGAIAIGIPTKLLTILYRGPSGPDCLLTWNLGPGGVFGPVERQGVLEDGTDEKIHTFTEADCLTPTINVSVAIRTPLENVTAFKNFSCKYPVNRDDFTFSSAPKSLTSTGDLPAENSFQISFSGANFPNDAKVQIIFPNGTFSEFPFDSSPLTINTLYNNVGHYTLNITILNGVSKENFLIDNSVLIPIAPLTCSVKYKPVYPVNGNDISAALVGGIYEVKAGEVTRFYLNTTGTIFWTSVAATFTVNSTVLYTCNTTDSVKMVEMIFDEAGEFDVDIQASNTLGLESCNLAIKVLDTPRGLVLTYTIDGNSILLQGFMESAGENSSYYIDNGQGGGFQLIGSLTTNTIAPINITFTASGTYMVTILVNNSVSSTSFSVLVPISSGDCSLPTLDIKNKKTTITDPMMYKRSEDVVITGITKIACGDTLENKKIWTVGKVDTNTGEVVENHDISNLPSRTQASLRLNKLTLDYGVYKVEYKLTMDTPDTGAVYTSSAFTYIKIERSDLIPAISDVIVMVVGIEDDYVELSPGKYSLDPDVPSGENQGIQLYKWFCKEESESVAKDANGKFLTTEITAPKTEAYIQANPTDNGGCFRDGPGHINMQNQGTDTQLKFSPKNFKVNMTYEFYVTIFKDTREATAKLYVKVVAGTTSQLSIVCGAGNLCLREEDGITISRNVRLSLIGKCIANCPNKASYSWTVYAKDYRWENGWMYLNNLEKSSYGTNSESLAIFPQFFSEYQSYSKFKVELKLSSADGTGGKGEAALIVNTNPPPSGGNCTLNLKNATAGAQFTVSCNDWTDDHGIESFEFYSLFKNDKSEKPLGFGTKNDHVFKPPVGAHWDEYKQDVWVRIKDIYGSYAEILIDTIQVYPVSESEGKKAIGDALQPQSDFNKLAAEGDVNAFGDIAGFLASALNSASKKSRSDFAGISGISSHLTATGFGETDVSRLQGFDNIVLNEEEKQEYEEERTDRGQARELIIKKTKGLALTSVESIKIVSNLISTTFEHAEECGRDTQDSAMDVLESATTALEEISETTSFEVVKTAADKLLSATISIVDSGNVNSEYPMNSELQRAVPFQNYDTDLESLKDGIESDDPDKAADEVLFSTNKYLQHDKTDKMAGKASLVVDKVSSCLNKFIVPGETTKISTNNVILQLEKNKPALATNKSLELHDAKIDIPPMSDLNLAIDEDMDITIRALTVPKPQQLYKQGGEDACPHSNAVSMDISNANGQAYTVKDTKTPFRIRIPLDRRMAVSPIEMIDTSIPRETDSFSYQKSTISGKRKAFMVEFEFEEEMQILALVRFGALPNITTGEWNYFGMIPNKSSDAGKCKKGSPKDEENNPCMLFVPAETVDGFEGSVYIALRQIADNEKDSFKTDEDIPKKFEPPPARFSSNISMRATAAGCLYFDEKKGEWKTDGCVVGSKTNFKHVECFCEHLTTFAGGWVVVPNTIDFAYVFSNMDFMKNITLYATEIVILVVYILVAIWARRQDKKDVQMLGISPLKDNDSKDKYYYEVVVNTGMRRNAGTKSKVFFILSGEEDETEVREFSDDKRPIFRRGGSDGFLMATPRPLGSLNYLRIWHDNSGKGKFGSWYLNYVIVRNVATDEKFYFVCNRWLAVEEDDGLLDRVVPVAGKEQMTDFGLLFADKTRKNLGDGHLWFSVVSRPPTSRFTRVQRVSCCLCLLYMTMLANAMFYNTVPESSNGLEFGPFSLSTEQVFIGIATNIIVFPANFLVILLFRKARPKKKRPSRIQEALKTARPKSAASMADVKPNLKTNTSGEKPGTPLENIRSDTSLYRPDTSLSIISKGSGDDLVNLTSSEDQKKKKKKTCDLPWWFRIVAWVLLWALVLVSAAFVTFYGVSFQDEKCKKWISSMLIAFFMSVFITQPIKVFLAAIFFSLVIKNPGGEDEDAEDEEEDEITLQTDEEYLHPRATAYVKPKSLGYKPLDTEQLERARVKRLKEIKMWEIIREIVMYCFFLWILMVISYRNRSGLSFEYKKSLEKVFILTNDTNHAFSKIRNTADFWVWAKSGLVTGIRAQNYYNGDPPIYLRGYINDKTSRIMGYAVMRQVRIRKDTCEVYDLIKETGTVTECNEAYSLFSEEKGTYNAGWKTRMANDTDTTQMHYTYRTGSDLSGYPYWGKMEWYGGGGYVYELRSSDIVMLSDLDKMEADGWIDQYTRAVFIEFTVYNPQINMFGISTLLAEMLPSNGFVTSYRFEPAMLLTYMSSVMLFQVACEIIYFIFTIFFIIKELRELCQKRKQYFKEFWNWLEMCIIAMSVTAICIYFYKLFETTKLTDYFAETHGNSYMKFQYVGYWNELFSYIIGWLVFLATLKFMKLLRFNKKMSLLTQTLRNGANSLVHFSIIFWIVFFAFIQLFYLTFAGFLPSFSTFVSSMESAVLMLMGKFDIYEMIMIEPYLTQIFVFLFLVTVTFILVNMFLSVLNETFANVRSDVTKQSNDYEIVAFMINRFKMWTGIGTPTPEDQPAGEKGDGDRASKYRNIEGQIDLFPDRIEKLLTSISNVYLQKDGFEELMNSQQAVKKGGVKGAAQHNITGFTGNNKGMTQVHTNY